MYWSPRSDIRSGKAYAKGPHLRHQVKKGQAQATLEQMELADRLLRLELSLKSRFWRYYANKSWYCYAEHEFQSLHQDYFDSLVGTIQTINILDLLKACVEAAHSLGRSEAQAKAAYRYWLLIKDIGLQEAIALTPKSSHYNHIKILHAAGFGYIDFQARNIVEDRQRKITLGKPIMHWNNVTAL